MLFNFGVTRRIREKHRVEFEWFNLRRDGFTVLQEEIVFDGTDFQIDATIDSFLDTDIFRIGYAYSLIREPKKEFGVHAGLHVTEIGIASWEIAADNHRIAIRRQPCPALLIRAGARWLCSREQRKKRGYQDLRCVSL